MVVIQAPELSGTECWERLPCRGETSTTVRGLADVRPPFAVPCSDDDARGRWPSWCGMAPFVSTAIRTTLIEAARTVEQDRLRAELPHCLPMTPTVQRLHPRSTGHRG
jgi:hypothetical protein